MSEKTDISWTDSTWNPIIATRHDTGKRGWHCEKISPECDHCYAAAMNKRSDGLVGIGTGLNYAPDSLPKVDISIHQKTLLAPLKWTRPRKIFVCSMTDAFGDWVTDGMLDHMFAVAALCPQHEFQFLTKRPDRAVAYLSDSLWRKRCVDVAFALLQARQGIDIRAISWDHPRWPLPNVWIGVTAGNQEQWDLRVPVLLQIPAAVRFVSCEPMLGRIGIANQLPSSHGMRNDKFWIIAGGESGPKARPMHPDWARSLRDQCVAAGVAFHFKQWGEWEIASHENGHYNADMANNGAMWVDVDGDATGPSSTGLINPYAMARVGKKAAGRMLDGRTWDEFPGGANGK